MSLPDFNLGDVYLDHIAVATKDLERSVSAFTKLKIFRRKRGQRRSKGKNCIR